MRLRCTALRWTLLLAGVSFGAPTGRVGAQDSTTVRIDENFRRDPNGVVLATLRSGTELAVISRDGAWTQVELDAWVWLRSLQVSDDPRYDLVVSLTDGENLRSGPSGRILGHLEGGALLKEVERDPAWARVSRTGWIWTASLQGRAEESSERGRVPLADFPPARRPGGFMSLGAGGGTILNAPDGDTLAVASARSDLEVVGREGNWVRVRLDGWMWMPGGTSRADSAGASPGALDPTDLMIAPDEHVGRVVAWTVQFISLERAEVVRTDFFEGEPFLLTRFAGGDGSFVYVAVPNERLLDVEGLVPLEQVSITGRVRTGASSLTGTPIVDLLSIERSREAP